MNPLQSTAMLILKSAIALVIVTVFSISPVMAGTSGFTPVLETASEVSDTVDIRQTNIEHRLSFSDSHIDAKWVTNIEDYSVNQRTVISNVGEEDAIIVGANQKAVEPRTSILVENVTIKQADSLVLNSIKEPAEIGGIVSGSQWDIAGNVIPQYPTDIPLWKSTQDSVGLIEADPKVLTAEMERPRPGKKETFEVKVNLWFATGNTNCSIHKAHDFLEVHSQIYGIGRMQKFYEQSPDTLYEDVILGPGQTHIPFPVISEEDEFVYPWHQYYADTDTIWMAIEFHPVE